MIKLLIFSWCFMTFRTLPFLVYPGGISLKTYFPSYTSLHLLPPHSRAFYRLSSITSLTHVRSTVSHSHPPSSFPGASPRFRRTERFAQREIFRRVPTLASAPKP